MQARLGRHVKPENARQRGRSVAVRGKPPYLHQAGQGLEGDRISGMRVLAMLGDSVSTDRISPVGTIAADGDSGRYLLELGVATRDFNGFGARRGNHHVMVRGTFANPSLPDSCETG